MCNTDMLSKVKAYVEQNQMIAPGDFIVAGVSGGADSVCLLFVLLELKKTMPFSLAVVHVDHRIRPESGADADFVGRLCRRHDLVCHVFTADIKAMAQAAGLSEEAAGREYRYKCFRRVLERPGKIAVAHHMDDRAETLLFNLFRGSGLAGLTAIRPVRDEVIRPLLAVTRKEIEDYLADRRIDYRIDATNAGDEYDRNRIRHHLLPRIKEINRQAVRHMVEAADNIGEAERYLRAQTANLAGECIVYTAARAEIDLIKLKKHEPYMQKRIMMEAIEHLVPGRKDFTAVHINALMRLTDSNGSKEIALPGRLHGFKKYDRLVIGQSNQPPGADECSSWADQLPPGRENDGKEIFRLSEGDGLRIPKMGILKIRTFPYDKSELIPEKAYTKWFDYDKITTSAVFRTRQRGDYLIINRGGNRKTLKEYMINEKIDRWRRQQMYILADGAHVLWIPGYRISEYYKVTVQTKMIMEISIIE